MPSFLISRKTCIKWVIKSYVSRGGRGGQNRKKEIKRINVYAQGIKKERTHTQYTHVRTHAGICRE